MYCVSYVLCVIISADTPDLVKIFILCACHLFHSSFIHAWMLFIHHHHDEREKQLRVLVRVLVYNLVASYDTPKQFK